MKRILFSLFLLSGCHPAFATDLPPKAMPVKAAAPAPAPSPFYIGFTAGAGFSNTQSDITLPGVATGTPKVWPAGFMAGGVAGFVNTIGVFSVGAELEADYDFTRSSVGCTPACLGTTKNGLFFAEKIMGGITLAQINGYVPSNAQAAHWPIPITVPASIVNNVMILPEFGLAQRNVDLCAADLVTGNAMCGSQWKSGWLFGGQVRLAASQNFDVKVEYNYIDFGHGQTFTPAQSAALFTNTVAAKNEQRFMVGANYHF
jgi:opacity protein-like surface antigen